MTTTKTAQTTTARPDFDTVKRAYETALATGKDSADELTALATAVAYSVLNKCIDPQRKTAADRETVSDNGYNPALVQLKRGIAANLATLDNLRTATNKATRTAYNADGDLTTETVDKDAEKAVAALVGETLSDGIDLVNAAALAILEQAAEHADPAAPWLDTPYTTRRLSRRVYIRTEDSRAYRDETTTPIQEVYRAVRQAVQDSRATQTDPRNGYTYIEDSENGLETIYYRLHKYADLGGYNCDGNYTADRQTVEDYETTVARLDLTDRQAQILRFRMQGKGYKAIATYLGIPQSSVCRCMYQVRNKAEKIGLTPDGYTAQD